MKWPRKKSMDKLKERIRQKTRRTDGGSMRTICEDLSRTLRGWFVYFKHSKANVFGSVDAYVRGRLRSILRKRNKKKGRGRGSDHQRWPNAYFSTMGLYIHLKTSTRYGMSIFLKLTTNWRAGCKKFACPVRREKLFLRPYPYPVCSACG